MILLDTHTWIWWVSEPKLLSARAKSLLDKNQDKLSISAISCWEFGMLVEKGRIKIDLAPLEWIENSLAEFRLELLPLTPAVAIRSTQLGPDFHGDPADRLLVATAIIHSRAIVSKDKRIRKHASVQCVW